MYPLRPPRFPEGFDIRHPVFGLIEITEPAWNKFKLHFPEEFNTFSEYERVLESSLSRSVVQVYTYDYYGRLKFFVPRNETLIYLLDEKTGMRYFVTREGLRLVSVTMLIDVLVKPWDWPPEKWTKNRKDEESAA